MKLFSPVALVCLLISPPVYLLGEEAFTQRFENTTLLFDSGPAAEVQTPGQNPVPQFLSQNMTLFQAASGQADQVVPKGLFPYQTHAQLWSDGARKERFFATPGTEPLTYTGVDAWQFPEGSITVKNFLIPTDARTPDESLRRVETRIFVRFASGWTGYTYAWNLAQTDAELLPSVGDVRTYEVLDEDGNPATFTWTYPSRNQCFQCHTDAAGVVLGITTPQLNWDYTFPHNGVTQNHLAAFESVGLFQGGLPGAVESLPARPNHLDVNVPLEDRLRSYIASNCSMCHRPGGGTGVDNMDFRWETPPQEWNAINVPLNRNRGGLTTRLVPGQPDQSAMVRFMEVAFMPFIGVDVPDETGIALLKEYVNSLGESSSKTVWLMY